MECLIIYCPNKSETVTVVITSSSFDWSLGRVSEFLVQFYEQAINVWITDPKPKVNIFYKKKKPHLHRLDKFCIDFRANNSRICWNAELTSIDFYAQRYNNFKHKRFRSTWLFRAIEAPQLTRFHHSVERKPNEKEQTRFSLTGLGTNSTYNQQKSK